MNDRVAFGPSKRFPAVGGRVLVPAPKEDQVGLLAEEALSIAHELIDAAAEAAGQRALQEDVKRRER